MSTLTLEGNIVLGPQDACEGGGPLGLLNLPFWIGKCGSYPVIAQANNVTSVASPSSFVALPGVGAADAVKNAKFIFVRTSAAVKLRLTQVGNTVQILDVKGLCILQFPSDKALTLLEAQGTATIEYVAVGDS